MEDRAYFQDYTQMDELWEHALIVLENYMMISDSDIHELYKFTDTTGVLEKHNEHFKRVNTGRKVANVKDLYFELINMLVKEEIIRGDEKKFREIKDVANIQGYQYLTNKLFRRFIKRLLQDMSRMEARMASLEKMLGKGEDKLDLLVKLEESISDVKEENLNHLTRLGGLEKEVKELNDKFHDKDQLDLAEKESTKAQLSIVETLEKRIDQNEKHIELLQVNDEKQDDAIDNLELQLPKLDDKLKDLEKADEFFREAHEDMTKKAQTIEQDKNNLANDLKLIQDDVEKFKQEIDLSDEKIREKLNGMNEEDKNIRIYVNNQFDLLKKDINDLGVDVKIVETDLKNLQADSVDGRRDLEANLENKIRNLECLTTDIIEKKMPHLEQEQLKFLGELESKQNDLSDLRSRVDQHSSRIEKIDSEVDAVGKNVSDGNEKIKSNIERLAFVDQDLNDLKQKADKLHEGHLSNLEKIVGLEDFSCVQQEKAVYLSNLESKVKTMDDEKQRSEAQFKQDLAEAAKIGLDLRDTLEKRFADIDKINLDHTNDIQGLYVRLDGVKDEFRNDLKGDKEDLERMVDSKINELDNAFKKNEKVMVDMRELNTRIVDDIHKDRQRTDEKLHEIRNEIPRDHINELIESNGRTEEKFRELWDDANKFKGDVDARFGNVQTVIKETKEISEKMFIGISDRLVVVEKDCTDGLEKLRRDLDEVQHSTQQRDENLLTEIKDVEIRAKEEGNSRAKYFTDKIQILRNDFNDSWFDTWRLHKEIYGAIRGNTVILRSSGGAAESQPACMGIYRSVDMFNKKPVYKQDGGENYLYFNSTHKCWMVASSVGQEYAWIRFPTTEYLEDDSSSDDSDSSVSAGSGRRKKRLPTKKDLPSLPDLFHKGWQYKPCSLTTVVNEDVWMNDDTLRVEPLGAVEKVMAAFQKVFNARQVD